MLTGRGPSSGMPVVPAELVPDVPDMPPVPEIPPPLPPPAPPIPAPLLPPVPDVPPVPTPKPPAPMAPEPIGGAPDETVVEQPRATASSGITTRGESRIDSVRVGLL